MNILLGDILLIQHHDFHMGVSPGIGGGSAYEWQAFFLQLGL